MAESLWLHNSITGAPVMRVTPSSASFKRVKNLGGGKGSASFQLKDRSRFPQGTDWAAMFEVNKTLLVHYLDGVPTYAGYIVDHSYSKASGGLSVAHEDLGYMLANRHALQNRADIENSVVSVGPGKGNQVRQLILNAQENGEPESVIPVRVGGQRPGTGNRVFHGYNVPVSLDAIMEVIESENGPDIDIVPQMNPDLTDHILWQLVISPSGDPVDFDGANRDVLDIKVARDGTQMANRVVATGAGMEKDLLVAPKSGDFSGYPTMEKTVSYSDVDDITALQELANEEHRVRSRPQQTTTVQIRKHGTPGLRHLGMRSPARVRDQADPYISSAYQPHTVSGWSWSYGTDTVDVELEVA